MVGSLWAVFQTPLRFWLSDGSRFLLYSWRQRKGALDSWASGTTNGSIQMQRWIMAGVFDLVNIEGEATGDVGSRLLAGLGCSSDAG